MRTCSSVFHARYPLSSGGEDDGVRACLREVRLHENRWAVASNVAPAGSPLDSVCDRIALGSMAVTVNWQKLSFLHQLVAYWLKDRSAFGWTFQASTLSWPYPLYPTATTVPSALRPTV